MDEKTITQVKKELEQRGNAQAVNIVSQGGPAKDTLDDLKEVLTTGAKEFESKVGRPMSYAEMRSMWG